MWFVLALAASVMWGAQYALSGRALLALSPAGMMVVLSACQLAVFGTMVVVTGDLRQFAWRSLSPNLAILAAIVTLSAAANWCIGASIQGKNPTVTGLVGMTYPLFMAVFAFLLFREIHVSPVTAVGALVVIVGLVIVALGAR